MVELGGTSLRINVFGRSGACLFDDAAAHSAHVGGVHMAAATTTFHTGPVSLEGVHGPIVLNMMYGALVVNIAPLDSFNVTLMGVEFDGVDNFIGPTSAGVTINGRNYLLTQNGTLNLTQNINPSYIFTLQLYNISRAASPNTIALLIRTVPNGIPIDITGENATLEIVTYNGIVTQASLYGENTTLNITSGSTAYQILSVRNLTGSKALPPLPNGYEKLLVEQMNLTSANPQGANPSIAVGISVHYNCSLPYYRVVPFVLSGYSWKRVNTFKIDPSSCLVMLNFNNGPVLAITDFTGASKATGAGAARSAAMTSTVATTTTVVQAGMGPKINFVDESYYIIGMAVLLVLAAAAVRGYGLRRKGKKAGRRAPRRSRYNQG